MTIRWRLEDKDQRKQSAQRQNRKGARSDKTEGGDTNRFVALKQHNTAALVPRSKIIPC